ncbi:uncharacterized protein PGTG_07736 [Puccinia graminis f. sp. tritici CRL 75-36-700-3]|uniref:BZIP domain-containing protein n=1 Tax=Puccinia graminis f. sp. tritici (strain CRL 75-36-700-3 / race SCCL) TaxID=418459 RepID=E3KBI1_PUCGT|nr:uncharacterized protein PGTG_07736 [Puccinia graminis f. sp. tritici CRL 75-36-700-3]EFP81487.2 hypothetical protein PGTG_07736 [Puccinia graminis f. sp. tritici CRL 75-36-700-3]
MVTYHGISHSHNTAQDLNQSPNLNHPMQHPNSLHTNLNQTHTTHPSSTSSTNHNHHHHHRKSSNDNDEEAIARKKKNADAQAAFRQRRQTYIKSLEDTVSELKGAVTEMEHIVKTTSQELKNQKQHLEHLQSKLSAYETGELKPGAFENNQHCKCCKFAPPEFNPALPTPTNGTHQVRSISTPTTSTMAINSNADCPTPSGPSIVTPTVTGHDNLTRDWPSRQGVPPMFPPDSSSRSTHHNSTQNSPHDVPHPTTSLDYPRNILHHQHHSNSSIHHSSYPRPGCDLALFTPFGAAESPPMANFYSSTEAHHGSSSQQHHPLGTAYSSLGHPQSFDAHHSGTLSSPRMWSHNSQTNPSTYTGTDPNPAANLNGSPKPGLYPIDGSLAEVDSSGFRLHRGMGERSMMRPADYLPSLELRPLPQSYPMVSTLTSPRADSLGVVGPKTRSSALNKRRWNDDRFASHHDNHEFDEAPNSGKTGVKLNGIPAKVARCEQVCTEVSKVVSQMKEEVKAVTTSKTSATPSTAHQSLSPNATSPNSFPSPHNASHNSLKSQRVKFHGPPSQLASSTPPLAGSQLQVQEEPQTEQDNCRYQSMISN